jgi:hypothetical protein
MTASDVLKILCGLILRNGELGFARSDKRPAPGQRGRNGRKRSS